MFKMLTGKRPPEATMILNEGFPKGELTGTGVSWPTANVVEKAMASVRRERYQSIDAFIRSLGGRNAAAEEGTTIEEADSPYSQPTPSYQPQAEDDPKSSAEAEAEYEIVPELPWWRRWWKQTVAVAAIAIVLIIIVLSCIHKISTPDGYINGHGYVDLGLPSGTKWATCNIGASSPEEYGNYYAWGETTIKSSYDSNNSRTYGKDKSELRSSGIIDGNGNLTPAYDAARANWGGSWRMPTNAEFKELFFECSWAWTTQGGKNGYRVTGPNGKTIFLPCARWRSGTSLDYAGESGCYWSSTPGDDSNSAYHFFFGSGYRDVDWGYRYGGLSVRPVSD